MPEKLKQYGVSMSSGMPAILRDPDITLSGRRYWQVGDQKPSVSTEQP